MESDFASLTCVSNSIERVASVMQCAFFVMCKSIMILTVCNIVCNIRHVRHAHSMSVCGPFSQEIRSSLENFLGKTAFALNWEVIFRAEVSGSGALHQSGGHF